MADTAIDWVDADGVRWPLLNENVRHMLYGVEGRFLPPMEIVADELVGLDGSRVRQVRRRARPVTIPTVVSGGSAQELRDELRRLASALDPARGAGMLEAVDSDGTARRLDCRYREGFEGVEDGSFGTRNLRVDLVFVAHDPLWRDVDAQTQLVNVTAEDFLSPDDETAWFPWSVVASDALGGFTVVNDGDDVAWPVWTVQGPASGLLRLSNVTSGEKVEISDVDLASGEQLEVDTRPGAKTAVGPSGGNLWPDLSDDSTLWPIVRGSQQIAITLEGTTPDESNVQLSWRRKWLTV